MPPLPERDITTGLSRRFGLGPKPLMCAIVVPAPPGREGHASLAAGDLRPCGLSEGRATGFRSANDLELRADRNIVEIIRRSASRSLPRGVTAGKRVRNPAMGNKRCS